MHRSVAVDARPNTGGLLGPQSLHLVDEVLQHQQRPAARHELVKLVLGHGEIIYGDTRWIEDDCPATFSEYIFGCESSPISLNVRSLVSPSVR